MKAIDIRCAECGRVSDVLADPDELQRDVWECVVCGGVCHRTISKPNVPRATYVDGTKRKGFEDLKKAAKLEVEMYNKPPDQRAEYQKEIHEYKKIRR